MIKINLLGQIEKPKKPKLPRKEISLPFSRKYLYIGLMVVAVGLFIYTYLPDIYNYFSSEEAEVVSVAPPPVQQEPPPVPQKPDTIAQVEPPPEPVKQPPVPEKVSDDLTVRAALANKTEIDGYCVLHGAVPKDINYTLISVTEDNFISELLTTNPRMKELFQNNISKSNFKISGANVSGIPPDLATHVWGLLPKSNTGNTSIEKFYEPEELIKKMRSVGRKSGFSLKAYSVKESAPQGSYKLSSVVFKFTGSDENTITFLKKLTNENYNFVIIKISGVPDTIKNMVQIALSLEVFIPA